VLVMILGILYFPKIRLGRLELASYWVIVLTGAATLVASGQIRLDGIGAALLSNSAINPLKILVLFISMTILSIWLDELGFFRYLADRTLRKAHSSQKRMFVYLYLIVSVLTVFTSNDVIILSFTPFVCYFAKNARINPIPYLAAEFVAANTWSMALIIGNPTNIYIGTANGVDFLAYLKIMILPTLLAGVTSFFILFAIYRHQLSKPIEGRMEGVRIEDKPGLEIGIAHLAVCTVLLAISSYIGLEMWAVSGLAALSLAGCALLLSLKRHVLPRTLWTCLKRAPWQLIPFLLSMFTITMVLSENGVTAWIGRTLGSDAAIFKYGLASFFGANIINNIPMSVLFCNVMAQADANALQGAVYATIAGSNIGAFMSPIGALAGIMWSSILTHHGYRFTYSDFLKMGVTTAVPALLAAMLGLYLVL